MSNRVTTHRGCDVFVSGMGIFYTEAECEFGAHTAGSLDALKKQIDNAGGAKQGPAKAFYLENSWRSDEEPKVMPCKCGRILLDRGTWEVWITEGRNKDRSKKNASDVYYDTAENRAIAERWIALKKHLRDVEREVEEVEGSLVSVRPDSKEAS